MPSEPSPSCPSPGQHGIAKITNLGNRLVTIVFVEPTGIFLWVKDVETGKEYRIYWQAFVLTEKGVL